MNILERYLDTRTNFFRDLTHELLTPEEITATLKDLDSLWAALSKEDQNTYTHHRVMYQDWLPP